MAHHQDRDSVGPHYSQFHSHISHKETEMVNKCQRLIDSGDIEDPLEFLRNLCLARGYSGFLGLGRHFRETRYTEDNLLDLTQFKDALKDAGFSFTDDQASQVFDKFDYEKTGCINIQELIAAIVVS